MAGVDFVFNVARGRIRQFHDNVKTGSPANSRLKLIALDSTGLETDATLRDHDDLAALIAGSSNEHTTLTRKTIVAADMTAAAQDDTNERLDLDMVDRNYTTPGVGSGTCGKLVLVYCPDGVTPGADSTFIPMTAYNVTITPDGVNDVLVSIDPAGYWRSN